MPSAERLKELVFLLNRQRNSDGRGSLAEKFFTSLIVNSKRHELDHRELMVEHERALVKLVMKKGNSYRSFFQSEKGCLFSLQLVKKSGVIEA